MTSIGKIARLPLNIREEVNQRLQNGETGRTILEWLNALPSVQAVLASQFGGIPVSHQNLTNWRQGGYQDWLKQQACSNVVSELAQFAEEVAPNAGGPALANQLNTVLMADLATPVLQAEHQPADPEEKFAQLKKVLHTVSKVRRDDYRAGRLALDREREAYVQVKRERQVLNDGPA